MEETKDVDELYALVRRSAGVFRDLPWSAYESVLDMLSGRYPSEDFAELRPRVVWQRDTGVLTARPGCAAAGRHLVAAPSPTGACSASSWSARATPRAGTSRGAGSASSTRRWSTRPASATCSPSAPRAGASRGSPTTRCSCPPAPGRPGRLPFWKGDAPWAVPLELGTGASGSLRARGRRPATAMSRRHTRHRRPAGLDELRGRTTCIDLPGGSRSRPPAQLPTDQHDRLRTVPRRARRLAGHACTARYGTERAHAPWALAVERNARENGYGMDGVRRPPANDGMVAAGARHRRRTPPGAET